MFGDDLLYRKHWMKIKPVNHLRWLLLCMLLGLSAHASDWTLYRFEGRDYFTLDNIAKFYGPPAPAPVTPDQTAAPATPAAVPPPPIATAENEVAPSSLEL